MADSTVADVSKMKLVDLRKELKSRGLSYAGDKAELIARLQSAISQDDHADINLDSDEIDSDGVLDDEDDKSHLEETAGDTINEDLALADSSPPPQAPEIKHRFLKRKITMSDANKDKSDDGKECSKKIVLNRSTSITTVAPKPVAEETENTSTQETKPSDGGKVRITAEIDHKTRLEMRAKRFGLSPNMTEAERKEARKLRFGQSGGATNTIARGAATDATDNLEKLKKRAERFGQSVSKVMTDLENKEKLEKRKAKFGAA